MKKIDVIGVFDSGIGGLSILRELINLMPNENFFYIADIAHSPYGEKNQDYIIDRIEKISSYLINHENFNIKTLVIACNTATSYSIDFLRSNHPSISIIGVEPALKLASKYSKTKRIGVLATYATIHSLKFKLLKNSIIDDVEFICQPCNELASSIDKGNIILATQLCEKYIRSLGKIGINKNEIDTIVLGCTHYPLIKDTIQNIVGNQINLIDTAVPVAKQTKLKTMLNLSNNETKIFFATTGKKDILENACIKFLNIEPECFLIDI